MLSFSRKYGKLPIYAFVLFFFELFWINTNRVIPFDYGLFLILALSTTSLLFCWALFKFWSKKFDYMAIVVIMMFITSLSVGVLKGWYVKDVLGDSMRFLAPFLAFYVGLNLFNRLNLEQIKIAFLLIIKGLFFIFLVEVFFEILNMFVFGKPFISYPDGGVRIPPLLVSFLLIIAYKSKSSFVTKFKTLLVYIMFILAPIMSASKSLLLSTVMIALFTPYKFGNRKDKLLIVFLSIVGFVLVINSDLYIVNRLIDFLLTLVSSGPVSDSSTSTRMVEVYSAISSVFQSEIGLFSLIFGSGSGALWFTTVDLLSNHGLVIGNFRPNGGVHHIHIELISLWFRHGLLGVILYLLLFYKVISSAFFICKYFLRRDLLIFAMSGAIAIQYLSTLLLMTANQSFYGHFYYAFIGAIVIVVHKKIKQSSDFKKRGKYGGQ